MTTENFINSGNLEAYLLGDLSPTEYKEVESMALKDDIIKSELKAIEKGLFNLAQANAVEAPAFLRSSILDQIKGDSIQVITEQDSNNFGRYMIAASTAIALISTALMFFFYSNQRSLDTQLSAVQNKNNELITENKELKNELNEKNRLTIVASNPSYNKIVLASTKEGNSSKGVVYWDDSNGQLYFIMNITEAIASNEDLQLWAIIDGKPVNAGVLNLNQPVIQKMKSLKGASTFAITIEPKGGSENPTLENMIMAGIVSI